MRSTAEFDLRIPYAEETVDVAAELRVEERDLRGTEGDCFEGEAVGDETFRSRAPEKIYSGNGRGAGGTEIELERVLKRKRQWRWRVAPGGEKDDLETCCSFMKERGCGCRDDWRWDSSQKAKALLSHSKCFA